MFLMFDHNLIKMYGKYASALWSNRRSFYKVAKPFVKRVVGKKFAKKVTGFSRKFMKSYRKYTPRSIRRKLAH